MFPSPYSDASTVAYWQSVAGKSDVHFYSGFLGYVNLLKETGPIAVMSFASGFLVLVTKGRRDFKEAFSVIIFFIVSFALIWPLFYSGNIFPRFVAGGLAGLILLLYVMMSRLAWLLPRKFLWLLPLVGLSVSGMDTTWSRLKKWASESTEVYLARSVETYSAGRLVNQSLDPEQLVVSDDPAKYLFDENLAYFSSHAGVAERKIVKELKEDFWAAVRRYKIGAFVVHPLTDLSDLARKQDCKETKTNNEVTVFLLNECRKRS